MLRVLVGVLCELEYIIGLPRAKRTLRVPRSAIPRSGRVAALYRERGRNRNKRARFDAGLRETSSRRSTSSRIPGPGVGVYKRISDAIRSPRSSARSVTSVITLLQSGAAPARKRTFARARARAKKHAESKRENWRL